mmetsp:Transcript_18513/g.27313  ORF Transcript_18513/g.27313 Transcript_18513/m.27313 type:complete len:192 (+) Transcript_18513:126-701(+)
MFCRDKSFLLYKLDRMFVMMDHNKNGTIEKKDYTAWIKKGLDNMEALGYEVTEERRKRAEKLSGSVYNDFTLYGLTAKNKKTYVGFHSVVSQMPGWKVWAKRSLKETFKLMDFDDSGDWSLDEYVQIFCEPIGISEEDAKESFKLLDTDGNGALDIDEVTEGVTHYLSDLEENKWSHIYGRIDYNPDKWEE